jgi:hypothetical protein
MIGISQLFAYTDCNRAFMGVELEVMIRGYGMRRTEPLNVDELWHHPLPMPMPNQPVCATELELIEQLNKLPNSPRIFIWTDSERRSIRGWEFLASVRQGVPPQGIEAELIAWCEQYPDAWLIVDLRDGVIPPSTARPLTDVLSSIGRQVIVMVSSSSNNTNWPQWQLPL